MTKRNVEMNIAFVQKRCSAEKCYVRRIYLVFSACRCMPKNKGNAINRFNKLQKNFTWICDSREDDDQPQCVRVCVCADAAVQASHRRWINFQVYVGFLLAAIVCYQKCRVGGDFDTVRPFSIIASPHFCTYSCQKKKKTENSSNAKKTDTTMMMMKKKKTKAKCAE